MNRVLVPDGELSHPENTVEYLSEWPPRKEEGEQSEDREWMSGSSRGSSVKRAKLDHSCTPGKAKLEPILAQAQCQLERREGELLSSSPSASTATLLARWWKMRLRRASHSREKYTTIPSSSQNPNTLLHHIAKCVVRSIVYIQHPMKLICLNILKCMTHLFSSK